MTGMAGSDPHSLALKAGTFPLAHRGDPRREEAKDFAYGPLLQ